MVIAWLVTEMSWVTLGREVGNTVRFPVLHRTYTELVMKSEHKTFETVLMNMPSKVLISHCTADLNIRETEALVWAEVVQWPTQQAGLNRMK